MLAILHNKKGVILELLAHLEAKDHQKGIKPCTRGDLFHSILAFNHGQCPLFIRVVIERIIDLIAWGCKEHKDGIVRDTGYWPAV